MKAKQKIKLGFLTVFMSAILYVASPSYFVALLLSVTIHELGHIITAKICRIPMSQFKLGIFGASLTPSELLYSYPKEILLCLGGPVFNFASILIFYPIYGTSMTNSLFLLSSAALGILNMLPIVGFDGGRILSALLNIFLSPYIALKILKLISFTFIFTLWCFSVYLLLRTSSSLTMFVFSISLFCMFFLPDGI